MIINENDQSQSLIEEDEEPKNSIQIYTQLASSSLQTALGFLLEFMPNTVIIYFLQYTNNQIWVGSFGLGILSTQAFGQGILNGLACGLETLVSQAFGAGKYKLCAKLYYRSIFLTLLFMIPISIYQICCIYLLDLIQNNQDLVVETGYFNRYMILAILFDGIFVNTKVFLNGQNVYNYQFYTQAITIILFIGLNYLFIIHLNYGLIGCAISITCLDFSNLLILTLFIYSDKKLRQSFIPFQWKYLHHTFEFLKKAIPIGAILWLEWVAFDCYIIMVSFLSVEMISAYVLMSNIAGFLYQFSYGVSIVATTYVGNCMGKKNVELAKKYCISSMTIVVIFILFIASLMFLFGDHIISWMTNNVIIAQYLDKSLYLLIIFLFLDAMQAMLSGLVRAIGKEALASISFIGCYFIAGEIIAYICCYILNWGLDGIWVGIIGGAVLYDSIQLCSLLWDKWELLTDSIENKLDELGGEQHQIDVY